MLRICGESFVAVSLVLHCLLESDQVEIWCELLKYQQMFLKDICSPGILGQLYHQPQGSWSPSSRPE